MTLYVPVQEKNREPRESEKAFTHTHIYIQRGNALNGMKKKKFNVNFEHSAFNETIANVRQ